ncbi:MAG: DUF4102 domain-containing protein [Deltaproteobacteria bacterium]|nr:MAG: DUF4102 domain-containing protein [Deltaproteobacteria bacterium]
MEMKIARYELYPAGTPTGYCVGFSITANGRCFYRDTLVSLQEAREKADEEIVSLAYERLRQGIDAEAARLGAQSPLLIQVWSPAP